MHRWGKRSLWVAIAGLAGLIFWFSGQDATASTDVSQGFLAKILGCFSFFSGLPQEKQLEILLFYEKPLRKSAHFFIYACLGFLIAWQSKLYGFYGKKQAAIVAISGFLYACSDELHQRFVPGRSGQWSDVCLDTAGTMTGYLIFLLMICIWQKVYKQREYN